MRIDVWSALPPAPSGIADYVGESLTELSQHLEVVCRVEDPLGVAPSIRCAVSVREAGGFGDPDLDVFHLGNSAAQGFAWRAARQRPGVVVLHEWCLSHVVRHETLARGDARAWRREARLGRGAHGAFFARLVEEGWGGDLLPLCFPSNEALIHEALGVVALSRSTAARVRGLRPRAPVLALPQHFRPPAVVPGRDEARRGLGVPEGRFLMVAPGLATPAKRLHLAVSSLAHLVGAGIDAELIVAGGVPSDSRVRSQADAAGVGDRVREPGYVSPADFVSALVAADVVLGLRFPSHGETSAASIRALGLGACVFLTAGSETAMDIPRGACVAVVPGPSEGEELSALLLEVARQPDWRRSVGAAARDHIARHHSVSGTVASLVEFLEEVRELRVARSSSKKDRSPSQSRFEDPIGLASYLVEEALLAGLELGVDPGLLFIEESVRSLLGGPV